VHRRDSITDREKEVRNGNVSGSSSMLHKDAAGDARLLKQVMVACYNNEQRCGEETEE